MYAATDAQSLVRLYEVLGPELGEQARVIYFKRQAQQGRKKKKQHASMYSASARSIFPWRRHKAEQAARDSSEGIDVGSLWSDRVDAETADRQLRAMVGQTVSGRGRDAVALSISGHLGTMPTSAGCVEVGERGEQCLMWFFSWSDVVSS